MQREINTVFEKVKDSGTRQEFATGARRDTQENKPRYDLIPLHPLYRLAMHYSNGAVKYGEHNWTKGMELSRFYASMFRHLAAWAEGDRSEDHLAAVAWNSFALMHFENKNNKAPDGTDLDDMAVLRGDTTPELVAKSLTDEELEELRESLRKEFSRIDGHDEHDDGQEYERPPGMNLSPEGRETYG